MKSIWKKCKNLNVLKCSNLSQTVLLIAVSFYLSLSSSLANEEQTGSIISNKNVASFKKYLIPEVFSLIRNSQIELEVFDSISSPQVSSWFDNKLPEKNSCEVKNQGISSEKNTNFLKAAYYQQFKFKSIEFDFKLIHNFSSSFHSFEGKYFRAYNICFDEYAKPGQAYREGFEISKPSFLNSYRAVTFDFFDEQEDITWIHSPVLKKTRRISASNRSDSILGTFFSLEDFLANFGKVPENFQVEEVYKFAPILTHTDFLKSKNSCISNTALKPDSRSLLSKVSRKKAKMIQYIPWLPTGVKYSPRKLMKYSFIIEDPYSLFGKAIVYIDTNTLTPVYKIIYDKKGILWKTFINVPVVISYDKVHGSFPIITYAHNHIDKSNIYFMAHNIRICPEISKEQFAMLDPGELGED